MKLSLMEAAKIKQVVLLIYALIAYGSLFPFTFTLNDISTLFTSATSVRHHEAGDLIGNILLFLPLGLVYGIQASPQKINSGYFPSLAITAKVFIFSSAIQALQFLIPERHPSTTDILLNTLGFISAYSATLALRPKAGKHKIEITTRQYPIMIALMFIGSELVPFIPTLDFQELKNSIKPLLISPQIDDLKSITETSIYYLLMLTLVGLYRPVSATVFASIYGLVFSANIVFIFNQLSWEYVFSPLIAYLFYRMMDWNNPTRILYLIGLTILAYTSSSIGFTGSYQWPDNAELPLYSYLTGSMHESTKTILFKLSLFSALIWMSKYTKLPTKKFALALSFWVLTIEVFQLLMPARTFDWGDAILVYIAYTATHYFFNSLGIKEKENSRLYKKDKYTDHQNLIPNHKGSFIIMPIFGLAVFYLVLQIILNQPNIPYNAIELFQNQGSILDTTLLFFFLWMLGGTCFLIITKFPYNKNPALNTFKHLTVSAFIMFLFLWYSLSEESIKDIVGQPIYSQSINNIQENNRVASVALRIFSLSTALHILNLIEYVIRIIAIIFLIQIPLLIALMISNKGIESLKTLALIVFLFCLSYFITYHSTATDNLIELINSPALLTCIILIFAMSTALTSKIIIAKWTYRYLTGSIIFIFTALFSWVLAQYALEQDINKYGYKFSALDFLLGPSRSEKIPEYQLFSRWLLLALLLQLTLLMGRYYPRYVNPALKFSAVRKLFKPSIILPILALAFVLHMTNRLFGEEQHWITIAGFTRTQASETIRENATKPLIPENPSPGKILVDGKKAADLQAAFDLAQDYSTITLSKGHYKQAGLLQANHVLIQAEPGAVIYGATNSGKGAIVVTGDGIVIEGIECHSIYVPHNNGVCIRLEGTGITLRNVYFHHSQGGLLGSPKGGDIFIEDSKIEHMGDKSFFHGIYSMEKTRLFIRRSQILNTRNGGHEIKSRSSHTEIKDSIIASTDSRDSRLIDTPNGGSLIIKSSLLIEGPISENHDLLSWGVEGVKHQHGEVIIRNNTIISDKIYSNLITMHSSPEKVQIDGNLVIGNIRGLADDFNSVFESRQSLSMPPAPQIPTIEVKNLPNSREGTLIEKP